MDFSLSEEQEMLKTAARDFLEKECPKDMVRAMAEDEKGYSPQLWRKMADLGWLALALPSRYGGGDGSFLDMAIFMEEMGRALVPGPFLDSVVLCGLYILEAGREEQKAEFLPKIASGETVMSLALTEPSASYEARYITARAAKGSGGYVINGTKLFVPNANAADYLLCVTRTGDGGKAEEGLTTFIVDSGSPGITCTLLKTIARDKQYEVLLENVAVPERNILGQLDRGWADIEKALQRATIALCASMVGASQQVLEMTVSYAKERIQFGQSIGSFQTVQHNCAEIQVKLEGVRVLTYEAAWRLSEGLPCSTEVSMAKAQASESIRQTVLLGHQIHGGVGYMLDHDLPLYFKWAKMAELYLGDGDAHRHKIAREMFD